MLYEKESPPPQFYHTAKWTTSRTQSPSRRVTVIVGALFFILVMTGLIAARYSTSSISSSQNLRNSDILDVCNVVEYAHTRNKVSLEAHSLVARLSIKAHRSVQTKRTDGE
jgi:hypothetical protein